MNALVRQLKIINLATVGQEERRKLMEAEKDLDEFDKMRKKVSRDIKDIRQQLAERNELLLGTKGNANEATVRVSAEVRAKIREINVEVDKLVLMLEQEKAKVERRREKGKTVTPEAEAQLISRQEVIDLCRQHIDECKRIQRQTGKKGNLAGNRSSRMLTNDPTITELPDIEGELGTELKDKDNQINQKLLLVEDGVGVLRQMATDMGKEIELQENIIAVIDNDVDKANEQLDNINARMRKVLTGVQKADNFCITVVMICIILGIAGFIYNQFG